MVGTLSPSDLKKLLDNENQPASQLIHTSEVTLRTNPAKRFAAGHYQQVQASFRTIFIRSHKRVSEKANGAAEFKKLAELHRHELRRNLEKLVDRLNNRTSKFEETLLDNYGVTAGSAVYSNPVTLKVEMRGPEEKTFWELCTAFDRLLVAMDLLWQHGEQDIEKKNEVTGKFLESLIGMVLSAEKKAGYLGRALANYNATGSFEQQNKPAVNQAGEIENSETVNTDPIDTNQVA